jgi:hypothetical protein
MSRYSHLAVEIRPMVPIRTVARGGFRTAAFRSDIGQGRLTLSYERLGNARGKRSVRRTHEEFLVSRKRPIPRIVTQRSRNNANRRLCATLPTTVSRAQGDRFRGKRISDRSRPESPICCCGSGGLLQMTSSRHFELSATFSEGSDDTAKISLRVGESVISRIADTEKQTVRDYFRASSTGLALWLADNWWRLRWETIKDFRVPSVDWRLRHELNSASGGACGPL